MNAEIWFVDKDTPVILNDFKSSAYVFLENGMLMYRFFSEEEATQENMILEINMMHVQVINYDS